MQSSSMGFAEELDRVLPPELPNREVVVTKASQHLDLIVEANHALNLTRITSPFEAAVKHVLDSVLPWRYFAEARHVLDAGTGAGFPGIPLGLVLPNTRFTLAESIQKKARFVDGAVDALGLPNVHVRAERAEALAGGNGVHDMITSRAMAPLARTVEWFWPALKAGSVLLLYKGPDVASEIAEAAETLRKKRVKLKIVERYHLPEGLGTRTLVSVSL